MADDLLTIPQAARRLRIPERTMQRAMRRDPCPYPYVERGARRLIPLSYVESCEAMGSAGLTEAQLAVVRTAVDHALRSLARASDTPPMSDPT